MEMVFLPYSKRNSYWFYFKMVHDAVLRLHGHFLIGPMLYYITYNVV